MKKIILIILFFYTHLFSQWFQQQSGTNQYLFSVFFIDANTGFITGESGVLLKTTNGGDNWLSLDPGVPNLSIYDSYFISSQTGWACTEDGIIIKTTNGGENWSHHQTGLSEDIKSIHFISESIGWAVGTCIFKTTNGGVNWYQQFGKQLFLTAVHFISDQTGFAGGSFYSIYKTTNSGNNWVRNGFSWPHRSIYSFSFPNINVGWAAGDVALAKTTNAGENWTGFSNWPYANGVHIVNDSTGWFVGGPGNVSEIYKSTNSGVNWLLQFSIIIPSPNTITFSNTNTGYAVGSNGIILKTTNGGEPIGIKKINSEIPIDFILHQNYPNPFNPVTKIKFSIPHTPLSFGEGQGVRLVIYDILGRESAVLVNENLKPGTYEAVWDASSYPSGVYFYRLSVIDASTPLSIKFSETKKMVLIK